MTRTTFLPAFDISVMSGQLAVRDALKQLLDGLKPLELDVEEAGTVELVMAEALNNIVEHAYPEGENAGHINITCEHGQDGLRMTVVDTGRAMPDGQTPVGTAADLNVDLCDMPEGGFGWFLIKDLAKDVTYHRQNAENLLHLRLAVALG
ncbi:MAG: ATP-binding protein [Pseudomonadota bacterium]